MAMYQGPQAPLLWLRQLHLQRAAPDDADRSARRWTPPPAPGGCCVLAAAVSELRTAPPAHRGGAQLISTRRTTTAHHADTTPRYLRPPDKRSTARTLVPPAPVRTCTVAPARGGTGAVPVLYAQRRSAAPRVASTRPYSTTRPCPSTPAWSPADPQRHAAPAFLHFQRCSSSHSRSPR